MTSLVHLHGACFLTHYPDSLEVEALSRYSEMFSWWMLAAFLTLLFLVVEMVGRAVAFPRGISDGSRWALLR